MDSIFNFNHLNNLLWHCRLYFHGHPVGGTNPSLLEAMASKAYIAAHDNNFNRDVLNDATFYFSSPKQASKLILNIESISEKRVPFIEKNYKKIESEFNWMKITKEYEALFNKVTNPNSNHNF